MRFNKPAGGKRVRLTYINNIDLLTHQVCGSKGVNVPPQRAASFHSRILSHSRCQRSEGDVGVGRRLFWRGLSFCLEAGGAAGSVWCRSSPRFPAETPSFHVFSGQIDGSSPPTSHLCIFTPRPGLSLYLDQMLQGLHAVGVSVNTTGAIAWHQTIMCYPIFVWSLEDVTGCRSMIYGWRQARGSWL